MYRCVCLAVSSIIPVPFMRKKAAQTPVKLAFSPGFFLLLPVPFMRRKIEYLKGYDLQSADIVQREYRGKM